MAVLADAVIATEENRKLLSDEYVIYLKVLVPTQMKRMEGNRAPLLPIENMEAFLNEQHRERDHFFEEVANLIIDSTGVEPDVKTVVAALDKMNA